ncbi:hypothetical protein F8M41_012527 [Gigaspora margarita]|uniref:Uncharacterized protein n=1 Tax=Gigaspora margarita TaxID=4874 RepID=A0A8H4AT14_GIGMA|nr:hypothetical protein F8M41_012527 [Gigaspora margarita]
MMHFGATTTQHVEGAHSAMKRAIETSGSLTKSFNSLERWLCLHYEEYLLHCKNDSVKIDPLLTRDNKNRLEPLLGTLLFPDKDQANYNYIAKDASSTSFDNFSLKSRLYKIEARYVNFPDEQQKLTLLKRKGRPSGTKWLPTALEHMEAENKKIKIWNAKKKQIKNVDSLQNVSRLNIEALAIAIRGNEDNWNLIKVAMNGQLNKRLEVYKHWLGYDVDLLRQILES